ncbi:MAG TPA: ABC transporter ATP-binding protein [Kofleriaceae bacterium]|nr:ABC transporter ATP-binding protein [Kofleriaceae bacterium]
MTRELAIRVHELGKRFGSFVAVDGVSFEVPAGEIFGYLGANGAGKSTTIRMLCGLLAATSGQAEVAGVDVLRHPAAVRRAIGYMSQRFSLYLDLTVRENLAFFGGAYDLSGARLRARRDEVVATLGLGEAGNQITGALPGGLRQRLALACALLHQPRVVFLDEPTAGVDPEMRRTFWRLIRRLARAGTTIFVTTHYMDEAEYCDRVGLMVSGRLAALDTPARLKAAHVPGRMFEVSGARAAEVAAALPGAEVAAFGAALHVRIADGAPWVGPDARVDAAALREQLARHGVAGATVTDAEVTLEDVFLRVVGGGLGGGVPRGEGGGVAGVAGGGA